MNSNIRRMALLAYPLLLAGMGSDIYDIKEINKQTVKNKQEWERKKCKSCKLFPCSDNRHKYRSNPLSQACNKYEKR